MVQSNNKTDNSHSEDEGIILSFASDNYAGVHPKIIDAILKANTDQYARPYCYDKYATNFTNLMNDVFETEVASFVVFNGTGSNIVATRACLPSYGAVIAPETAHINTDEAGAPERSAGIKVITASGAGYGHEDAGTLSVHSDYEYLQAPAYYDNGKITPDIIKHIAESKGNIHSAQPRAVTISNVTELGTVYSPAEIAQLADTAHSAGLKLHIDGARIFNAVAAKNSSFKEMLLDTGVDVVSLGGTKIGAMGAEAIVVFDDKGRNADLADAIFYGRKQMTQLASKGRYLGAQLVALFEDDLGLSLARHSNDMMKLLSKKIEAGLWAGLDGGVLGARAGLDGGLIAGAGLEKLEYLCEIDANSAFPIFE
ncbi:MAG: hypothetical protein LBN03_01855, partial [Bifidobacteriaceae bacterium]|nr:hypothetical protein [Bifidobacteriaceae bacterium]